MRQFFGSIKNSMNKAAGVIAPSSKRKKTNRFWSRQLIVCMIAALVLVPTVAAIAGAAVKNSNSSNDVVANGRVSLAQQKEKEATPSESAEPSVTPSAEPTESQTPEPSAAATTDNAAVAKTDNDKKQEQPKESSVKELVPESTSAANKELQARLMELNYMDNDEPTEYYGPATQEAVSYFQRKHDLNVDGVAGEETQDLLFSSEAKQYTVSTETSGADVEGIQSRLSDLGYGVSATGYYGSETTEAVKYFQRMNGLSDDGTVGADTKEKLYSKAAVPSLSKLEEDKKAEEGQEEDTKQDDTKQEDSKQDETKKDTTSDNKQSESSSKESSSSSSSDKKSTSSSNTSSSKKSEDIKDVTVSTGSNSSSSSSSSSKDSDVKGSITTESSSSSSSSYKADPGNVEAFISAAMAQKGKKYVRGGKGPNSFDCSGFVYYALNQSGNKIGYMTSGGWATSGYTTIKSMGDLQRGDVICFTGHVGIYLGNNTMIDASSSKGQVVVRSMGSWARSNFKCGKRPL